MAIKISMVVWNEFVNDARVLKEAETLQLAGFQVTVHALKVADTTLRRETTPKGVSVVRAEHFRRPKFVMRLMQKIFLLRVRPTSDVSFPRAGAIRKVPLRRQIVLIVRRSMTHLRLIRLMLVAKPDIVHAHDVNTLATAWVTAKLSRAKLVYDAHEISTDREGYKSFRNLVARVEKFIMPRASLTMTTTDTRAKFFARAYGIKRPLVLQNRPRFHEANAGNRIREELGVADDVPIVLYQGGLQQGRGLDRIVDAAKLVENANFVFIGGGRMEQGLKAQVESLSLGDRVHFIPTVALAKLPSYTVSADIGVQAIENTCLNHFSTDSNKLFEYLIAGLPIVATNMPEIRKIVQEYNLGHLVPESDTVQLADAIQRLVDDAGSRERFAKNARTTARVLNWEAQEKEFIDAYKDVVNVDQSQTSIGQSVEDPIP